MVNGISESRLLCAALTALTVLAFVALLAACGSDAPTPTPRPTPTTSPTYTPTPAPTPTLTPTPAPMPKLSDREVLVIFYHATGGPNWTNNANWLSDKPIAEWDGVTTDYNGRVTKLYLADNQLSGEIPAELGSLSKLEMLYLGDNQLGGEIPAELGNLFNLIILDLSNNCLSGEIPAEFYPSTHRVWVSLYNNCLTDETPPSPTA